MKVISIPRSQIFIPKDRQRKIVAQEELMELAGSISRIGLINPITVEALSENVYTLIAGERRFRAHELLNIELVPCVLRSDLDANTRQVLELEENAKRVNLTWQEEADAVSKYHNARVAGDPEWTQEKTAHALGMSTAQCGRFLSVNEAIKENPDLAKTPNMSTVVNLLQRQSAREMDSILESAIDIEIDDKGEVKVPELATQSESGSMAQVPTEQPKVPPRKFHVLKEDFFQWDWDGPRFNLIHCDFPYGVNMDSAPLHGSAAARYEDTPDVYFELIREFIENQDAICAASCHIVFWFSMKFYVETVALFRDAGWTVNPMPLVWAKEDLKGILPDPNRGPRQCYETALLMTRGDRKIVRPVANLKIHPTSKETGHLSEKPIEVVKHFLSMLIDDTTSILDPTCGSATAIAAAEELGANIGLGLEKDEGFYQIARRTVYK